MIKFLCPSGHELSADERMAGKPGKCPKCQVRFLIPELPSDDEAPEGVYEETDGEADIEDREDAETEGSSPSEERPAGQPPPAPASQSVSVEVERAPTPPAPLATTRPAAAPVETFAFLCPNGHKLSGPLSLQGKPGQCPHCQERFLIPVLDAFEPERDETPPPAPPAPPAMTDFPDVETAALDRSSPASVDDPNEIPEGVALDDADGFASAWSDLWPLRASDEPLEVYFSGGGAELVHRYAAHPSDPSLVLLATREDDGRFTIIAARWSSILRVAVRRCEKLPAEWFGP